jgi:trimethylamine--corrinoid protein Co-methyltransferase
MLAQYQPPPLDEAIDVELIAYIEKRKAEMPDGIG